MKRILPLLLFLAALSAIAGYLLTKGSWAGRLGMGVFHKEYVFLNTWWKGTLSVFGTLLVLVAIHALFQRILPNAIGKSVHAIFLLAALTGLYLTYYDFQHDWEHHLMKQRFHMGFYLFWAGWIIVCIFFLFSPKKHSTTNASKKAEAAE